MRSPFAPFALALALASLVPATDAAACSTAEPELHVLAVSSHYVSSGNRLFVVLDELAPANAALQWRQLAPNSYDASKIAEGPTLAQPMRFTLLGPHASKVVTSDRRVYLAPAGFFDTRPHVALEVDFDPDEEFDAAMVGAVKATWHNLPNITEVPNQAALTWVSHVHADLDAGEKIGAARLQPIPGTDLEVVSLFANRPQFAIRRGEQNLGLHHGVAVGELEVAGRRLLVLKDFSTIRI